jgi:inhibitor of KinA sporulation pathway (predicted exonuclease)
MPRSTKSAAKSGSDPSRSLSSVKQVNTSAALHAAKAFRSLKKAQTELHHVAEELPDLEPLVSEGRSILERILKAIEKLKPRHQPARASDRSTRNEILKLAKMQAQTFKAELIEKNLVAPSSDICDALGFTRQSLNKAVKENRMFYLQQGHRRYYPMFYADSRLSRHILEDITKTLGDLDGAQKWQFFTMPKGSLSGKTPLEALQAGLVEKVLIAAHGFVEC